MIDNIIHSNTNDILITVSNQLENIMTDLKDTKKIDNIIKQLGNIIFLIKKFISDNKQNTNEIKNEIQNLNKEMINNFQQLKLCINYYGFFYN